MDPNLVFFFGGRCPFTERVGPEVVCLQRILGRKITRLEVWEDEKNQAQYEASGGASCGGVPYFYNSTTGKSVCGAAPCAHLVKWAKGEPLGDQL